MSDLPMKDWINPDGPFCEKAWIPLNVPDPKYDICLLPPEHDGDCRTYHFDYVNTDMKDYADRTKYLSC